MDADYTYGLERIAVHDEDTTTGKVQDPLYYLYDGMGRVTELTKPTAQVSYKYRFDAFGIELPGGKMPHNAYKVLNNPFGYNGEQYDLDAGMSYLRNRYYEPETGRFMNRDLLPGHVENPLSMNAYAYVANNPLQFMDPLGLEQKWNHVNTIDDVTSNVHLDLSGLYNDRDYQQGFKNFTYSVLHYTPAKPATDRLFGSFPDEETKDAINKTDLATLISPDRWISSKEDGLKIGIVKVIGNIKTIIDNK